MRSRSSLLSILSLLSLYLAPLYVNAVTIKGQINFNEILPRSNLPADSKLSLNHGERKVWIRKDGSFELLDVDEGAHILEPMVPGHIFQPLLITVTEALSNPASEVDQSPASPASDSESESDSASQGETGIPTSPTSPTYSIHVQHYNPTREPFPPTSASLPHPLALSSVGKEQYFTPPGGMNIMGMLKNPMVLMMLFSGVMMYGLPKLTASMADMDPEMAKDMAETQKKMQGMQSMDWAGSLSNMLAGPGADAPPALAPAVPAVPAGSTGSSGTNTPSRSGGGGGRGGKTRRGR